jgi:hypothetical protein
VQKSIVYNKKEGSDCLLTLENALELPNTIEGIECAYIPTSSDIAKIVTACAAVGIAAGLLSAAFAWKYRKSAVMRNAQPKFCFLFSFFLGLLNVSWILKLGEHSGYSCMIGEICFHICFTLGFGAMLCKMHRVVTIFGNKQLKKMVIKDSDLAGNMLKLLLVDCFLLVCWAVIDPLEAVEVVTSIGGVEYTEVVCQSEGEMFATAVYFNKILLLGFALNLAYKSRELGHFAESSEIAGAIYIISMMSGVAAVAGMLTDYSGNILIKALSSALATVTAMLLFYTPKVKKRNLTADEFRASVQSASTFNSSNASGVSSSNNTSAMSAVLPVS